MSWNLHKSNSPFKYFDILSDVKIIDERRLDRELDRIESDDELDS